MKMRIGFVSNSSSSSFIIIGTPFSNIKNLRSIMADLGIEEEFEEMTRMDIVDLLCEKKDRHYMDNLEIEYTNVPYDATYDEIYLSLPRCDRILEDMNLKEARNKFTEIINQNGIELADNNFVDFQYGAFYDG